MSKIARAERQRGGSRDEKSCSRQGDQAGQQTSTQRYRFCTSSGLRSMSELNAASPLPFSHDDGRRRGRPHGLVAGRGIENPCIRRCVPGPGALRRYALRRLQHGLGCQVKRLLGVRRHGIGNGRHLDDLALHQRFQVQAADPPEALKSHARPACLLFSHALVRSGSLSKCDEGLDKGIGALVRGGKGCRGGP